MTNLGDKKTCQVLMFLGKLCERPMYDEKEQKCIFHSSKFSQKKELFDQELKQYLSKIELDKNEQFYDFSAFVFPEVSFEWKEFSKPAIFREAKFREYAKFFKAKFKDFVDFESAEFQVVLFADVSFQLVVFTKTRFCNRTDFSNAKFNDTVNFIDAEFKIDERFVSSAKLSELNKEKIEFLDSDNVDNSKTISATFYSAEFYKEAHFTGAQFHYKVHFSGTSFLNDTLFLQTTFHVNANFFAANFGGLTIFRGLVSDVLFYQGCDFREVSFRRDAVVKFQDVNLEKVRFLNTNLEHIYFSDVRWYQRKDLGHRRIALWDEFRPLLPKEKGIRRYESIAENYRQLVLNYERKRDYESAEHFHIGEMEMRRMKVVSGLGVPVWFNEMKSVISDIFSWIDLDQFYKAFLLVKNKVLWFRKWINSYQLYKLVSSYGTSYWRAFWVLIFFLLSFSLLFLYSGFETSETGISGKNEVQVDTIEYNIFQNSAHSYVSFGQWFSDYLRAIQLTMTIITFQRERFFEPIGMLGRFLLFAAVIVLASQAALVLLAIRRRFKR